MKKLTKTNCKLCMWGILTILKKLRGKYVMVMNNNLNTYRGLPAQKTLCPFLLSTDDPV